MNLGDLNEKITQLGKDNARLAGQVGESPFQPVPALSLQCHKTAMTIARSIEQHGLSESRLTMVLAAFAFADVLTAAAQDAVTKATNVLRQYGAMSTDSRSHAESIKIRFEKTVDDANAEYLLPVFAFLDALDAQPKLAGHDAVAEREETLASLELRAAKVVEEAEGAEAKLREAIGKKAVDDSLRTFEGRESRHTTAERFWGKAVAAVVVAAIAYAIWFFRREVPSEQVAIGKFVAENLLALTAITALLRLTVKRWSLERNLAVLYAHRVASLAHYRTLNDSIPESEAGTKGALRLQVMQMIYSDPATGYREDSSSDISINPAVTVLDRIGKASA